MVLINHQKMYNFKYITTKKILNTIFSIDTKNIHIIRKVNLFNNNIK